MAWFTLSKNWQDIADEAEKRHMHNFCEIFSISPRKLTDVDYCSLFGLPAENADDEGQLLNMESQCGDESHAFTIDLKMLSTSKRTPRKRFRKDSRENLSTRNAHAHKRRISFGG